LPLVERLGDLTVFVVGEEPVGALIRVGALTETAGEVAREPVLARAFGVTTPTDD
jgi:hypothetical protein